MKLYKWFRQPKKICSRNLPKNIQSYLKTYCAYETMVLVYIMFLAVAVRACFSPPRKSNTFHLLDLKFSFFLSFSSMHLKTYKTRKSLQSCRTQLLKQTKHQPT